MGPRLRLPEIVLCPAAFQLPGAPADDRHYLGDFVDLERHEEPLSHPLATAAGPLVYCSLGSSAIFYPHARRFFAAVAGASRLRRDWRFVLHIGDHPAFSESDWAEPNLLVRRHVPQLSLLRCASVMVTHGGLNSIMECIRFEVPMVIVPGLRDQPGNAVRAVHHKLAVTASMARLTPPSLVTLLTRVMADRSLRVSVAAMNRTIAAEPGLAAGIGFIERQARATPPAGQSPRA